VLFDIDGTLVDTTYLHTVCWWQALRQLDHDVTMAKIHRAIGMGSDRILDELLGEDRDRQGDADLHTAKKTLYSTFWDRLRPLPGARDLPQPVRRTPKAASRHQTSFRRHLINPA